jgi:hypothetical protein
MWVAINQHPVPQYDADVQERGGGGAGGIASLRAERRLMPRVGLGVLQHERDGIAIGGVGGVIRPNAQLHRIAPRRLLCLVLRMVWPTTVGVVAGRLPTEQTVSISAR